VTSLEHAPEVVSVESRPSRPALLALGPIDVVFGSFVSLALFAGAVASIMSCWAWAIALYGLATRPSHSGTGESLPTDLWGAPGLVVVIFLFALFCVVIVTGLTLVVFGPIAGLLGLALRRVVAWPAHLVAYFALGNIAAYCVAMAYLHPFGLLSVIANPSVDILAVLAGTSAAAGWVIAWRSAVKRDQAQTDLLALIKANADRPPLRDERF
jgi:hypothetical protein